MRQEFRFVSRNVDAHRAIALATLAGEAEVERFFHGFAFPAVFDEVAFGHLPKQVGATAGGVLFLTRDAVAWTHHSAGIVAAFADSHAAPGGRGQAAVVVGQVEVRLRLPGIVARAETQIFVEAVGIDELARIHLPIGIPERFELAESLHEFRAKHFGKQFAAGLPVSMFTGDGTSVADHKVGSVFHELAELANAFRRFEIVVHARMHAGMTEVPVEGAIEMMVLHQLAQVAEVGAQLLGSDGRVFKAFPAQRFAGDVRGHAQAGFADVPNAAGLAGVGEEAHIGRSG